MNHKLESLIRAMDEYAQAEHDCKIKIVQKVGQGKIVVLVSFDDDIDGSESLELVLTDRGRWLSTEMVEVLAGESRVLVSAIPAAVVGAMLEM